MKCDEFARQLGRLQSEIFRSIVEYETWLALWPTEEAVDILNQYKGFFATVRGALYESMLLGFAKVFDKDPRTMSFRNLIAAARKNMGELVPHITLQELDEVEQQIMQYDPILGKATQLRNQYLAHLDANPQPIPILIKGDIDKFIEALRNAFNQLSIAHDRSSYAWSSQSERPAWEASEVLRILREESERVRRRLCDTET